MGRDWVTLLVGGKRIEHFLSFRIDSDIYTADDAFSLDLAKPETEITAGLRCELYVNDEPALTGLIDRVSRSYGRQGQTLKVEGRDLMGLLVDSCCEEFPTLEGLTTRDLAEQLLANVPFIGSYAIVYDQADEEAEADDSAQKFTQITPGQTIFDALKNNAMSRGLMFFSLPDGTMVFGKPKSEGDAEAAYSLICRKDGAGNNVLDGERTDDISKRYSKVTVVGQQQGRDSVSAEDIRTGASVEDDSVPYYKPFVTTDNNDSDSPDKRARMVMERQRFEGFKLSYKVPGLTQGGRAWTTNELCRVEDEVLGLDGEYLLYGRTFEMSRQGVFTSLRLGLPGFTAK